MHKQRTLLAVFAHPDDESFSMGGAMALYASHGDRVYLVCATRGEVGEIRDTSLATADTLGQVREQELRNACRLLGIHEPIFLGYRDSGMRGTPENQHPSSLSQARPADVAARLAQFLLDLNPDTVVTFDPNGGYGHPDHIAIHHHTTAAFAALRARSPSARLYYTSFPRSLVRRWHAVAPEDSPMRRMDPETLGLPDELITTRLDVSPFVELKINALACHRTQVSPQGPFSQFPREEMLRFLSTEHFHRAQPPAPQGLQETDLFP
ncbi:MAG: PIG-L family deacetylase [Chloroflexi bacterium]|nr:PIG-L family deacetylase [Chloroflexota bacterium]